MFVSCVSCIIVNYNNENFIKQCIDSVIQQSRKVDEIIIADDCSTDNSLEIIHEYAKKYKNIRVVKNKANVGVSKNRDNAIRLAKGEFITTLDSDDYYYPQKIENETRILDQFPDAIACSDVIDVDMNGQMLMRRSTIEICSNNISKRIDKLVCGHKKHHPKDLMYSKNTYIKVGGINTKLNLNEDWDFKLKLAGISAQWIHSGVIGTAYRHTGTGLSSTAKTYKAVIVKFGILLNYFRKSTNKIRYAITFFKYCFIFGIIKLIRNSRSNKYEE